MRPNSLLAGLITGGVALLMASCSHKKPPTVNVPSAPAPSSPSIAPQKPARISKPQPKQPENTGSVATAQPALGELLSDGERNELLKGINSRLVSTQQNVAIYRSKPLSAEQIHQVERIDVLVRQAQEAKANSDLRTAKNIAERAYLLSQALLK